MRASISSSRFATAMFIPALFAACATEPEPVVHATPLLDEVLADAVQRFDIEGNMRTADGTPVKYLSVRQTWSASGLAAIDPATVDPADPETAPTLQLSYSVQGHDAAGQLLFESDAMQVGTRDFAEGAPITERPLAHVAWRVRGLRGLATLDPANPDDAAVIAGYADTINNVLAYAVADAGPTPEEQPTPTVDTGAHAAPLERRVGGSDPRAYFEGCTAEVAAANAFDAKCLLKLLSLLEQTKTCIQRINKAVAECRKPNNNLDCLSAVGDVILCLGKLGIDGYMFYDECMKKEKEPGLLIIPDQKLVLPGDKEFVLPPPKK
ncbi:MAG TPA: hypothetical protein VM261_27145 [Kofleriaceae bacterium]|nr:hypothetical protein [Kofleriaceae bacterium]